MTRETVMEQLETLPLAVREAEMAVLRAEEARQAAENGLQAREDELLVSGEIDGKNADLRAAQMRQATAGERAQVEEATRQVARLKIELHYVVNQFAALRALARLLANSD
jgi:hypothetical protein